MPDPKANKIRVAFERHADIMLRSLFFLIWATSVLMLIMATVGVVKVCMGVYSEIVHVTASHTAGVVKVLEGLELIFISPLVYLLVLSVTKYFHATRLEVDPALETKREFVKYSLSQIGDVKKMIVSLFITFILLHLIKSAVAGSLDQTTFFFSCIIAIILIGYYSILAIVSLKGH